MLARAQRGGKIIFLDYTFEKLISKSDTFSPLHTLPHRSVVLTTKQSLIHRIDYFAFGCCSWFAIKNMTHDI